MLYQLILKEKLDQEVKKELQQIQRDQKEKRGGIYELYDMLCITGKCSSYSKGRIYYVGYTLAESDIDFTIIGG